jgi:ligand-binding sensor domain-containing protein
MKNEMLYIMAADTGVLKRIKRAVTDSPQGEHVIVGSTDNITSMVSDLNGRTLKPTVVVVYHSDNLGQEAANMVRKLAPEAHVVSYAKKGTYSWGNTNISMSARDPLGLIDEITKLQH